MSRQSPKNATRSGKKERKKENEKKAESALRRTRKQRQKEDVAAPEFGGRRQAVQEDAHCFARLLQHTFAVADLRRKPRSERTIATITRTGTGTSTGTGTQLDALRSVQIINQKNGTVSPAATAASSRRAVALAPTTDHPLHPEKEQQLQSKPSIFDASSHIHCARRRLLLRRLVCGGGALVDLCT